MNEIIKPVGKNISLEIRVEKKYIQVVNAKESPEARLFVKAVGDGVTIKYENADGEMERIKPGCEVITDSRFPKYSIENKYIEERIVLPEAAITCVLVGLPEFKAMTREEMTNFAPEATPKEIVQTSNIDLNKVKIGEDPN